MHAPFWRRFPCVRASALALVALLLGGIPQAAAWDEMQLAKTRSATWDALLRRLSQHRIHIDPKEDLSPSKRRTRFAADHASLRTFFGAKSGEPRLEAPKWRIRLKNQGVGAAAFTKPRLATMVRDGVMRWGKPASVTFRIATTRQDPDKELKTSRGTAGRRSFWVGFEPRTSFEVPSGTKPPELLSRLVEGTRSVNSRAVRRTYAGLAGHALVTEQVGLLEGRIIARTRSESYHDTAQEGTRLQRMDASAWHAIDGGWVVLSVDAYNPVNADPDATISEKKVHALLDAFAQAYRGAGAEAEPRAEVGGVRLLDANPIYTGGMPVDDIVGHEDLRKYVKTERKAVAADGVTQIVIEVELDEPGLLRLETAKKTEFEDGEVRMLFGGRALATGAGSERRHVAYALYTPPRAFAEPLGRRSEAFRPTDRYRRRVAMREIQLVASTGKSMKQLKPTDKPVSIPLVRPPVVLVHGTFDNPEQCWEESAREIEPSKGTISMAEALRRAGYIVSKVDYRETNGMVREGMRDHSSFRENARVLWERLSGIYDTLSLYRNELDIAVTQVDVVGHSLGGLIPRLWVSDEYNKPDNLGIAPFHRFQTKGYRRIGNFQQGDIHRLITIATTHKGSDLGHLGIVVEDLPRPTLEVAVARFFSGEPTAVVTDRGGLEGAGLWVLGALKGYGISAAVRDQRPHLEASPNAAIADIGATRVPSHAIVCAASLGDMTTFDAEYKLPMQAIAFWMLNARPAVVRDFFLQRGQAEDLDRLFGMLNALDQTNRRPAEGAGHWLFDAARGFWRKNSFTLYAIARAMLFGNSQNDMVVRVESQRGDLPFQYRTFVPGVLHSFATRYERVQHAVVEALCGPHWRFSPEGFPAPTPMRNNEPYEPDQDAAERAAAIEASNIVPSHAQQLAYVADQEDIIIVMRPVNEHATPLIAANIATKDMHVKGKSSNWGPQRGYIPVEQRFSKLHFETTDREKQIKKFDGKVRECLDSNRARETALEITVAGTRHAVLVIDDDKLEPPQAIVLKPLDGEGYKDWQNDGVMQFDPSKALPDAPFPADEIERKGTRPFMVLADRNTRVPLTADYDILAFGPRFETGELIWDDEMGAVAAWQKDLISKMNKYVRLRANYSGGNVSHHGPEVQFELSPGADYPNAVFEADGDILLIREGPPGQKDLYLKRYFHLMRAQGWNLAPNPHTWNWGEYDPERWPYSGWRPEDHLQLPAETSEADNYFDSDEGDEPVAVGAAAAEGGR